MIYAMEYCGNNDYRDYLAHHGVKGMKWGKHLFGDLLGAASNNRNTATNRYIQTKKKASVVKGVPKLLKAKTTEHHNKYYDYDRASRSAKRYQTNYHQKAFDANYNAEQEQQKYKTDSFGRPDNATMVKVSQYRSDAGKYQREASKNLRKKLTNSWLSKASGAYEKYYNQKAHPAAVRSAGSNYSLTNKVLPSLKKKKQKWDRVNDALNQVQNLGERYGSAVEKAHKSLTSGRKNEQPKKSISSRVRSAITSLPGKIKSVPQKIISAGKAIVDRIVNFFAKRFKKKKKNS